MVTSNSTTAAPSFWWCGNDLGSRTSVPYPPAKAPRGSSAPSPGRRAHRRAAHRGLRRARRLRPRAGHPDPRQGPRAVRCAGTRRDGRRPGRDRPDARRDRSPAAGRHGVGAAACPGRPAAAARRRARGPRARALARGHGPRRLHGYAPARHRRGAPPGGRLDGQAADRPRRRGHARAAADPGDEGRRRAATPARSSSSQAATPCSAAARATPPRWRATPDSATSPPRWPPRCRRAGARGPGSR